MTTGKKMQAAWICLKAEKKENKKGKGGEKTQKEKEKQLTL